MSLFQVGDEVSVSVNGVVEAIERKSDGRTMYRINTGKYDYIYVNETNLVILPKPKGEVNVNR